MSVLNSIEDMIGREAYLELVHRVCLRIAETGRDTCFGNPDDHQNEQFALS